jgi:hypothetical protein
LTTIREAASTGSQRDLLVAMRDKIATELDGDVPARDLASLTKRLMEITREVEAIDAETKGDDVGNAASTPDEPWPVAAGSPSGSS